MYRGHSNWNEDEWDIHSDAYAGHGKGSNPSGDYHKNDSYGAKKNEPNLSDDYRASKQEENENKNEEDRKPGIVDAVEQEEKKQEDNEQETFQNFKDDINQKQLGEVKPKNRNPKKNSHKSIEEAISKAIKEEKEVLFMN